MSAATTTSLGAACPSCATEIGLDAFMRLCLADEHMRGLVADLVAISLPLSADVLRYLRLFKPAKQALKTEAVRRVLAELAPAMQSGQIEARGRLWACGADGWRAGFAAVFAAFDAGKLKTPLTGNAYLFGVLANMADQLEAKAEASREQERKAPRMAGSGQAATQIDKGLQSFNRALQGRSPMPPELRNKFKKPQP